MSNKSRTSPVGLRLDPLAHLFVAIVVLGTIAGIGGLLPKARRDDDVFGMAAAATVVLVSVSGCAVAIWLMLTRRILQPALEDFLSVLLFGTLVWMLAFLLPHARRDHDPFAVVASLVAALLALLGWLLIGSRVFSG